MYTGATLPASGWFDLGQLTYSCAAPNIRTTTAAAADSSWVASAFLPFIVRFKRRLSFIVHHHKHVDAQEPNEFRCLLLIVSGRYAAEPAARSHTVCTAYCARLRAGLLCLRGRNLWRIHTSFVPFVSFASYRLSFRCLRRSSLLRPSTLGSIT
jgi:hypothetical protein